MVDSRVLAQFAKTDFSKHSVNVTLTDDEIVFATRKDISEHSEFQNLLGLKTEEMSDFWLNRVKLNSLNAFILRYILPGKTTRISPGAAQVLGEYANKTKAPYASLSSDRKYVEIFAPRIKVYRDLFTRLGAYPTKECYRLRLDKLSDMELLLESWKTKLPKIQMNREVSEVNNAPVIGFDGTINSLKEIPIGALNVVQANIQTWKALKKSKETLEDKLAKHGIPTLHDLLFRLPRKYIDKSKPQLIDELIIGEKATVIGTISSMSELNAKVPGLRITVTDDAGSKITATFWRQNWLKTKFKVGSQVILNGTVSAWMNKLQLSGDSIEHFDDGFTLPVVPIYKQSENNGITSGFLIAAMRELLQRMGELSLPVYFKNKDRANMKEVLEQLHFPSNLDEHEKAVLAMAYYELVYMQLIIQHERDSVTGKPGVAIRKTSNDLQLKAAKSLPYSLTNAQIQAIKRLNKQMSDELPSSNLLLADVGSGKTLAAQLAALRAVDAGKQVVFVAPTDVLARQLHSNTEKLLSMLKANTGETVTIDLLTGGLKAAERKALLARIGSGETQIIIGTQAVFSDSVKYFDLGLVIIDEQQKFGAEQRTKLLEARNDGRVPDLLMQTATPIPRTTAQVYYGDVDIITMNEKPPGRVPIITEWIQEDPQEMLKERLHPVWIDVATEAKKGNQTFVIAPMVVDSPKVDAASVERAFKELSGGTLGGLRIAFVHGSMKAIDQRETMEKFRNREYDVLVASTVIEVGVDVPDATRVIILSADRLGASSLHQIRGRVGRSDKASKCYLVSLGKSEHSQKRLQALVDSDNGFDIAKIDLEIRGEGTMFATEQSGRSDMIFAKLAQHADMIEEAKEEAKRILRSPFKGIALRDAQGKFDSSERLF